MSSIDNRIVEMQFDNKRFEQNAKQSMSTLDKLKDRLRFKDSTRELEDFQDAADRFNLSRIADAVEQIGNRFTMLGQLGEQAMVRIANAAISAGTTLLRSISIDQISAGMGKYEQETGVIQTIYGALKPKGVQLDEIYEVMNRITEYSDETSYSYSQMADAVSKFVNAGVDLKDAEIAIEGISNAAALAGIGIHDTEIIYRNFSDAIGKGRFTLQDWKSIKIAHMDTQWLKESFINEAIEQGKADAEGYLINEKGKRIKKGGKYVNIREDFEDTLRYGWLDTAVINGTMFKYANRELDGFGKEAFAAAQNAKTFTDVLDALKDTVSTGWSRSFRIIFGDLEEAIAFFTPMANAVTEFAGNIAEARNEVLQAWKDFGGRNSMIQTLSSMWEAFKTISDVIGTAFNNIFNDGNELKDVGLSLFQFTNYIRGLVTGFTNWIKDTEHGGARLAKFQSIIEGLLSIIEIARVILGGFFHIFTIAIGEQLGPVLEAIIDLFSLFGYDLTQLLNKTEQAWGIGIFFQNLADAFKPLTSRLPKVIDWIKDLYLRFKKFWNTDVRFKKLRESITNLFSSFVKFVPKALESIISWGKGIIEMVKNSDEWKAIVANYNRYVKPWISQIFVGARRFNDALSAFFNVDTSGIKTMWGKIKARFQAFFDNFTPWLNQQWAELKKTFPWLQKVEDWWNSDPTINAIKDWVSHIAHAVDTFLSADTSGETSIVGKIKMRFKAMWDDLGPWLTEQWNALKTKYPILQTIEDTLNSFFGGSKADEIADADEGAEETGKAVGFLGQLWDKIQEFLGKIDVGKLTVFVLAIKALASVYKTVKSLTTFAGIGESISGAIEEVGLTLKQIRKNMKKQNMLANVTAILEIAAAMWLLGDTLVKVSSLTWEEIVRGLGAMAGLFVETGAFMIVMGALSKKGVIDGKGFKSTKIISMAISMYILGQALKNVSSLKWPEIGRGLAAMGGLFVESGAFMILVNRFGSTGLLSHKGTSATGLLSMATSMYILGKTLKNVSSLKWPEIGRGLAAMGGLFVESGAFMILVNRFGSPGLFKRRGASASSLVALALSMQMLGNTLKSLSEMKWPEIGRGLAAMGAIFIEEGAFMILVNRLGSVGITAKKGLTLGGLIGTTGSIVILAGKLKDLSQMTSEEIERGLWAMAGIFAEEGAFMVIIGFLSKKDLINPGAVNATTGILAGGIGAMAGSMAKLATLKEDEILRGALALAAIEVLLGIFVGVMSKFKTIKVSQGISMAAVAGAIWIMVQAFIPLTSVPMDQLKNGILGLVAVAVVLGLFCFAMSKVEPMGIKSTFGVIVSAIALAALMVAFAFAITLIKDVDPVTIVAFGAAVLLVTGAMELLAKALKIFSEISIGAALKGTLVMIIAAAGLAVAIALILGIAGNAIENFAGNLAMVGSYLSLYSDTVSSVDKEKVDVSIQMLKDIADAFVYVGTKNYENLETFKTNLTRMGASIKLFDLNTANVDPEKMKTITAALKQMATDLSGFPEVADVGTAIGNIGGAIKLYSESLNGVNLDEAPDTSSIQTVFNVLKDAIPNDENLSEVGAFASEGKGNEMTNFAIGLTNIATAVSSFSESAKDLDFTNMDKAVSVLDAIAGLKDHLTESTTTSVGALGAFGVEVTTQQESLSTFAEDIVTLGTSLQAFATSISSVNKEDLDKGVGVLDSIASLNEKLPKEGGLSQWFTGSVSLTRFAGQLKLLGEGAKSFNDSIMGGEHDFDADKVKSAGTSLEAIADINAKLPKTGGISSWFTGDQNLGSFGKNLKELGKGVAEFSDALNGKTVDQNVTDAILVISKLASIQVRLSNADQWYDLATFGDSLSNAATYISGANETLAGITWTDTTNFQNLLNAAIDAQVKLGGTQYKKTLRDIGNDLKGFYDAVYSFNTSFLNDNNGKLNLVTESVTGIFNTLNTFLTNTETDATFVSAGHRLVQSLAAGISDETSKNVLRNKVADIAGLIMDKLRSFATAFRNSGLNISSGLGQGIKENKYAVINAVSAVINEAILAGNKALGIESPSKVFAKMGMYSDLGFARGFLDYLPVVTDASQHVSDEVVRSVTDAMADIQNLPLEDMSITPTIRPVLDTGDISSNAWLIDHVLGGSRTIGFNTRDLEAQAQLLNNSYAPDLASINQQVIGMNERLDRLSETITQLRVVLNTGELVGGLESEIDKRLGARSRRAERGG